MVQVRTMRSAPIATRMIAAERTPRLPCFTSMTAAAERDYVLGTHDDEVARLGLQHRVWRPCSLDAWRRAGFTVGQTLLDIGRDHGKTPAQVAIAWCLAQPGITSVIAGADTPRQAEENADAEDLTLSQAEWHRPVRVHRRPTSHPG